uniref:Uncharacterized protein n=1 Tax=Meloidogyne incognita TaxID=6306 RepID=A0A914LNT7_MELIC
MCHDSPCLSHVLVLADHIGSGLVPFSLATGEKLCYVMRFQVFGIKISNGRLMRCKIFNS